MSKCMILAGILIGLAVSNLRAQVEWTRLNGPYGGWITFITEDDNGRIYAGSDALYYSDDKGENWSKLALPPIQWDYTLQYVFIDSNKIFINASEVDDDLAFGVMRFTDDYGKTWKSPDDFPFITASLKKPDGNYYIGAYYLYEYKHATGELIRLTDTSQWHPNGDINSIMLNDNGDIIISARGIYKSTDGGKTFDAIALGNVDINDLCKSNQGTLLAATFGTGIFRSSDNGTTWLKANIDIKDINKIISTPDGNLLAATYYYGIYQSTDDGLNWNFYSLNIATVSDMILANDGSVYLSNYESGIYKSTDNGLNWDEKSNGINNIIFYSITVDNEDNIFCGTYGRGAYRSSDGGMQWQNILSNLDKYGTDIKSTAINSKGFLFATEYSKIFRSKNQGQSWDTVSHNNFYDESALLSIDQNDNIYLSSDNNTYISTDNGDTWNTIKPKWDINGKSFFIDQSGNLFACVPYKYWDSTAEHGVARSTDKGKTWEIFNNGLDKMTVFSMAGDNSGNLYLFGGYGLYKSNDKGEHWAFVYTPDKYDVQFFKNINNRLYLIYQDGAYISRDKGISWDSIAWTIPGKHFRSFAMDSVGYFYVATNEGIFKSNQTLSVTSSSDKNNNIDINTTQNGNMLYVSANTKLPSDCRISIYNMMGSKCVEIFSGLVIGRKDFNINTENFVTGIYFIRLESTHFIKSQKIMVIH